MNGKTNRKNTLKNIDKTIDTNNNKNMYTN